MTSPPPSRPLRHLLPAAGDLPRLLGVVAASEALPGAPEPARAELADLLLSQAAAPPPTRWRLLLDTILSGSGSDPAARARVELARRWAWLGPQARDRAAELAGPWAEAVRAAATDPAPAVRASAAMAAGAVAGGLGVCCRLLEDADGDVAREAERTLVSVARRASEAANGATERASIEDVVARAAARFAEHRRHGALLAAVLLLDPASRSRARRGAGAPLARWALGPADDGHAAMRSALRKTNHPLARRRAVEWLAHESMATAALDRLNRARDAGEHEAALQPWALILHPRRRARLAMIRPRPGAADGPVPTPRIAKSLSEDARIGLCLWLAHVRLSDDDRRAMAERALADPSPRVRWAALRSAAPRDLEDFAFDRDGRIAHSALLRLSGAAENRAERGARASTALRRAQRLERHPDARIRALAATECDRIDPWRPAASGAAGVRARRMLADDPDALLAELRQRIVRGAAPDRVRAMTLARRLDVCPDVEDALLESARSAGPAALAALDGAARDVLERVGATAVRAMGALASETSREALAGALRHTSPRIRANAVEALAQRTRRSDADTASLQRTLIELKSDGAHRVRANAICALLRGVGAGHQLQGVYQPGAAEELGAMVGDDRIMHRIAGLWAAQRLLLRSAGAGLGRQWTPLAARLADVARSDADPRARARAAACVRALQIEVRSGWRGRAPSVLESPASAASPGGPDAPTIPEEAVS